MPETLGTAVHYWGFERHRRSLCRSPCPAGLRPGARRPKCRAVGADRRSIREQTGRTIETITADLTLTGDVNRVASLIADNAEITVLITMQAWERPAPLLRSDANAMSAMIALNVEALTRFDPRRRPRLRSARAGNDRQYRMVVAITARKAERGLWRQQGVCPRLQSEPPAGARG